MAGDRVDDLRRVAELLELDQGDPGVTCLEIRVLLVIEVVDQPCNRVALLVFCLLYTSPSPRDRS